jgi:CspA family cold shock protein
MASTGTVKFFNVSKGYGFIKDDKDGAEIFVHSTGLLGRIETDDKVSFEISENKQKPGKGPIAVDVKKI